MNKFIKLTYTDNTETWVNVAQLAAFELNDEGTTDVVFAGTIQAIRVKETPTQILAKFP
jgi:hypothetical protein